MKKSIPMFLREPGDVNASLANPQIAYSAPLVGYASKAAATSRNAVAAKWAILVAPLFCTTTARLRVTGRTEGDYKTS